MRSKAKTLSFLGDKIKNAIVLDQLCFTTQQWKDNKEAVINSIKEKGWIDSTLIVRSSAYNEDTLDNSCAGQFESILNVKGVESICKAITKVDASFNIKNINNEIFIQPMLENVKISGVLFSRDPNNNSPYIKINYDDSTGRTDTITSGRSNETETFYCHRLYNKKFNDFRDNLISLCFELEDVLEQKALDIEFAIDKKDNLYLFQARPLIINEEILQKKDEEHYEALVSLSNRLENWIKPHPYLCGDEGVYGVMPDWNPAEIVGIKPRPLALSLYRELITNSVWAYQRDNYGYRNLRSFPLLIEFEGMPYVDIRVSFNSFIPKALDEKIANKLVNYYLDKLKENACLHDKVEFDILFSCYVFNTKKRLEELKKYKFSDNDIQEISRKIKDVTNKIICNKEGLWKKDLEKIYILENRYKKIVDSSMESYSKIYWLIEDCKRYGTLPFAGLARAGFIAVEFLKSFVTEGIFSNNEYDEFLASLNTVSSSISLDFQTIDKEGFLKKYGHLRPGTYDILSRSYEEDFNAYFNWEERKKQKKSKVEFKISLHKMNLINEKIKKHKLSVDALSLINFIKEAIEAREFSKFIFTRSVNKVLTLFKAEAKKLGIKEEDAAYTHIGSIMSLNSVASDPIQILKSSIKRRKKRFELTKKICLPPLISRKKDVFFFYEEKAKPNYITQKRTRGVTVRLSDSNKQDICGKIVLIENADPGYDWVFSHNILALITKYGGANSHMAIRSGELGIPAIIGAGSLYNKIKNDSQISIDCLTKSVEL